MGFSSLAALHSNSHCNNYYCKDLSAEKDMSLIVHFIVFAIEVFLRAK